MSETWNEWFWRNYDAGSAGFFERGTLKHVSTEDLCKAYAASHAQIENLTIVRCRSCKGTVVWQRVGPEEIEIIHGCHLKPPEPEKPFELTPVRNQCNRHDDCAAAEAAVLLKYPGKTKKDIPFNFHCHDDECEDCFGS